MNIKIYDIDGIEFGDIYLFNKDWSKVKVNDNISCGVMNYKVHSIHKNKIILK